MSEIEQVQEAYFEVGAVAKITGLSPNTIRTWERRNFIKAASRSESGRRRYSQEQVECLALIKKLTDLGDSISALSSLSLPTLRNRLLEYQTQHTQTAAENTEEVKLHIVGVAAQTWTSLLSDRYTLVDGNAVKPDIVAIDLSTTPTECRRRIALASHEFPDTPIVLIYDFAPSDLIMQFTQEGRFLIRVPCSPELFEHYLTAARVNASHQSAPHLTETTSFDAPKRLFTDKQLATIASSNPNIKCECPHHISALVSSLASFENYCRRCEIESPTDAEVHSHLGSEIAKARSIVEEALLYLCQKDNLNVPPAS
ncbi:MAG: MerR family transcriptional regulator [Verrucomicrobiota bacterium]